MNVAPLSNLKAQQQRLQDGLEQGISLVIAKSVIALLDLGVAPTEPFQVGLSFSRTQIAEMLFAAATDHRYLDVG